MMKRYVERAVSNEELWWMAFEMKQSLNLHLLSRYDNSNKSVSNISSLLSKQ